MSYRLSNLQNLRSGNHQRHRDEPNERAPCFCEFVFAPQQLKTRRAYRDTSYLAAPGKARLSAHLSNTSKSRSDTCAMPCHVGFLPTLHCMHLRGFVVGVLQTSSWYSSRFVQLFRVRKVVKRCFTASQQPSQKANVKTQEELGALKVHAIKGTINAFY